MSVVIEPSDLSFRRPFTIEVSETLRIKNPNPTPVAFKVKTTAPKQYCVRPNSGRIEADRYVEVTVLLQAMKQDPAPDYKCRDKFLVQSVPLSGDKEFIPVTDIWDHVEKSGIQEKKIRVNFLPAEQDPDSLTPARPIVANGYESTPDVPPPAYASPHEDSRALNGSSLTETTSDAKHDSSRGLEDSAVPAPLTAASASSASPTFNEAPTTSHSSNLGTIGAAGTAAAVGAAATAAGLAGTSHAVSNDTTTTSRDILSSDSSSGKDAEIAALKAKLAEWESGVATQQDGGLRQRKVGGESDSAAVNGAGVTSEKGAALAQATRQGTEGVPVQVAALLCLLCFLLAYFFF